jgi:hypothetical protein
MPVPFLGAPDLHFADKQTAEKNAQVAIDLGSLIF